MPWASDLDRWSGEDGAGTSEGAATAEVTATGQATTSGATSSRRCRSCSPLEGGRSLNDGDCWRCGGLSPYRGLGSGRLSLDGADRSAPSATAGGASFPEGRLVTILIVVGGLLVVQLSIQRVLGLTDSGYFHRLRGMVFNDAASHAGSRDPLRIWTHGTGNRLPTPEGCCAARGDRNRPDPSGCGGSEWAQGPTGGRHPDETLIDAGLERCRSLVVALLETPPISMWF